jgi:MFS family permease
MNKRPFVYALLISALGYFVDVFDIILFSAVRVPSLQHLGLSAEQITSVGILLINIQVIGMLIGGVIWGILADKRGRLSVLLGSILLYSSATLANAYVTTVEQYAILRFLAGFGLAGELGAAITLVSETMGKDKRGYGMMMIVVSGALGGLAGGFVGQFFTWQTAYILGGAAGFILLFLRLRVNESGLFLQVKEQMHIKKGNLSLFLRTPSLSLVYIKCLLVGFPFWIFVGLFVAFAPELGEAFHVEIPITAGQAMLFYCLGLAIGELSSSLLSQYMKSRKKIILLFQSMTLFSTLLFFSLEGMSTQLYYQFCVFLGFGSGFWVLFMMIASEQFGTNIRATVTTSLPNFVRGMVIPSALLIGLLKPLIGIQHSLGIICIGSLLLACIAAFTLKETFSRDLDFIS